MYEMAKKENIPVIFFNREPVREDLMQWDKLYYVGGDARQSGMMQGEIAADMIRDNDAVDRNQDGKIQYVLLEGETGHQDAIIRTDSVVKTIKEQGIILERLSFQFANWNRGQAENKMTQLINQYGDEIELVLSNNDEMALGAVAAYDALDYDKDRRPMIFGIDGLEGALDAVQKGTIQGTVYNDRHGQADPARPLPLPGRSRSPGHPADGKRFRRNEGNPPGRLCRSLNAILPFPRPVRSRPGWAWKTSATFPSKRGNCASPGTGQAPS